MNLLLLPIIAQGICMAADEGYYHRGRVLPKWELIGHPIDTMTVLICLGWTCLVPFTELNLKIFIGLAALSCLCVTKDEFVHHKVCPAAEQWLHSLLFVLHPCVLGATGILWFKGQIDILRYQFILIFLFWLYQIVGGIRGVKRLKSAN